MALTWIGRTKDMWRDDLLGVCAHGVRIVVAVTTSGIAAYLDRCPHLGIPLSRGRLENGVLTCGAHQWEYDACSGEGLNPRGVHLEPLPLRIIDGDVFVELDEESLVRSA
jgi:toluene monooxygenase system ferredoxin subunit